MEKWKNTESIPAPALAPEYGPLSGMRVLVSGTIVAAPFAATMLSDFGAEFIQIERPKIGDPYRGQSPQVTNGDKTISAAWIQGARNRLSFTLNTNMKIPESKEIFLSLIKISDVWIENMVWIEKLGITDEMLFEVNPKLIIVHISGFGRPQFGGNPEVCNRGSYDPIGQAEGGYMLLNGFPEPRPPQYVASFINDYIAALIAANGITAAYVHAMKTGQGQVVEVAQVEAMARVLDDAFSCWMNAGVLKGRFGNKIPIFQPANMYKGTDGRYVYIGAYGPDVYGRFLQALELDPEEFPFQEVAASREAVASPLGQELERRTQAWMEVRTAQEIQDHLSKFRIPLGIAKSIAEIYEDPHWHSRGMFINYEDQTLGKEVKAFGFVPKMSETPGTVWRGSPALGQDTETILSKLLGYSDNEIAALKGKGIID